MTSFHLRGTDAAGGDRVLDVIRANAKLGSVLDTAVRAVAAAINHGMFTPQSIFGMIGAHLARRGSNLDDAPPLSPFCRGCVAIRRLN